MGKRNVLFIYCAFLTLQNIYGLHRSLKYYETIHSTHFQHKILKRGIHHSYHPYNRISELEFYSHGRHFRLILTPRREVIHSNFKAYEVNADGKEKTVHLDHDNFYHGRVFGEIESHAQMHIDDGIMTGSITILDETFHIEPSWRHLSHLDNQTMITHGTPKTCGYVKEDINYTLNDNSEEDDTETDNSSSRVKRQTETYEYTPTKTRCPLLLVADYRFYQEMGASSTKTTINYLISLIDRVHKIYNDTLWQEHQEEDGFKGMGFVIKKIVVHSEPTRVRGGETHYNMVREKWDVRTLLEVFSREYSHKDFCLAHLFTDLKFEGGILGLAYVGSPRRNSVGGICTPEYFKNGYTLYLNSGLSSSRNHYGQRVITREADLVTAHEFGHNWGSEHDPDISECSPSASQGGSYLMYTYSVSGYDVNNKRFSPCSLRSIRKVLQAKSGRCFSEPEESFCGNLRVEGDEECDAGLLGTEDNDSCCDKNCKLRSNQGAVCSDKNSPCCQGCAYMPAGVKCRDAQYATCEQESRCTGASSECPRSPPMKDGTDCLERGQCRLGKCVPYCETQNLQSCMCDTIADACKRCCRMNLNETCFPIDQQDILPDGTPCIQGFCNKGVCEKTIQDVVERFWDIIEDININKVMRFLKDNIVGAVIIITAVIWIPASCVISYIDHRRVKESEKKWQWKHTDELIHPDEPRQVIYVGGQRQQRVQHVMHQS
ncbi:PREDICTED: ADAM 17-like protease isoform X3 [Trachymyrmex cornetzi]|uniref:ADAM 17-like protease isoform X3 n=1 Tax=Trachymyrmex cornetzi TaxID=471704 RepID=UPI00084F7819|nr:PREDICTED: ADAM 17-like protease isoform X3 [Trachymyrmex cornetzi]